MSLATTLDACLRRHDDENAIALSRLPADALPV